jgi:hypothetical protein
MSRYIQQKKYFLCFYPVALQPNADHGLTIILEVSTSHNAPHSVGLFWMSDQFVSKTST